MALLTVIFFKMMSGNGIACSYADSRSDGQESFAFVLNIIVAYIVVVFNLIL